MNEMQAWQQGYSDGVNVTVQQLSKWCELDCKTLPELIAAIKQLKEVAHD